MKQVYKFNKSPKLNIKNIRLIPTFALSIVLALVGALSLNNLSTTRLTSATTSTPTITIKSPQANAYFPGNLNLEASLSDNLVSNYDMFWYVDNGSWNWMNNTASNTKQATVNVGGWTWHSPSTAYTITIVAVMHSNGQRYYSGVPINVGTPPQTASSTTTSVSASPTLTSSSDPSASAGTTTNTGINFYINPYNDAAQTAATTTDLTMKRVMTKLAATPTAAWFGDWNSNVQADVNNLVTAAANAKQTPVLVAYDIPERDCGSYSGGGATSAGAYQDWIQAFANGIGSRSTVVILEPDAVPQIGCLSSSDQTQRDQLLKFAITTLKSHAGTKVYLDAGNPSWLSVSDIASKLEQAGVAAADGFSLNVSNFIATSDNFNYGNQISAQINGKHFVVDTGRNGNGSNGQWCNPSGRAVGATPTSNTGDSLADYLLWIKTPGESDGSCNGGPAAGSWWPSYAETLALNAGW